MKTLMLPIMSLLAVCGWTAIAACARVEKAPQEQIQRPQQPREGQQQEPAKPSNATGIFDLGGPCRPRQFGPLALTGKREEELRVAGQWETLIEAAKQDVRSACSVPHRWYKLFTSLANGHRYREAEQVAEEVARRGFPFPHALLSSANSAFLTSDEFTMSEIGIKYSMRESEVQRSLRLAEERLASLDPSDLPANPYRSVGACPFECCTYRQWKTRSAVKLRETIDSGKIIGEIPPGSPVQALTGEVRVEPEPYAVLQDNGILKAGDVIFFLDYRGEGHINYHYGGKLNPELGIDPALVAYTTENCNANAARGGKDPCWLKKLRPDKTFLKEWWVKIRMANGKVGWALNTGQFENVDACG